MKNHINKPDILKWYIYKIMLIMRLTIVVLMISMLQISAATLAQEFNYVKKGVSLIQIFKEIKKQTGYNIIWNEKKIDVTTTIDANFRKATIQDVLDKCLKNLSLSYSISDKMVMIKENEPSFRDKVVSFFTAIDVRGRVVDENNAPLMGAIVKVKGTAISTPTNTNGEFLLKNVNEKAVLVISFVGYETQEVKAAEKIGHIRLIQSTGKLEEVEINAGYYKVKDHERTGNISKITSEIIGKQPINNPLMALQGRVSGLQIFQSTGLPGGGFTVYIRGQNSIASGNDPLYIIDGVNYPSSGIAGSRTNGAAGGANGNISALSLINPNDIESIEILKDADATAIYGSRGANGVILITTKKGKDGKSRVEVSFSQGINQVAHQIDLLNTEEYLQMRREAFKNDGLQPTNTDYDINGTWDQNKYTDWQKELIGRTASTSNASLNIGGGNEKNNYLIAGNYYTEGIVFPGKFGFERTGIRSNINIGNIQDRFNVSFNANFSHTQNKLPANLVQYISMPPNMPDLYDEFGGLNWANNTISINPFASILATNEAQTDDLVGNLTLNYRVLGNLRIKTSLGYTTIRRQEFQKLPLTFYNPSTNPLPTQRVSLFGNNYNNSLIFEPQLTYEDQFGAGKIQALVGVSLQDNSSKIGVIRASNFTSDDLMENIGSAGTITNDQNDFYKYRYFAAFARINYSLASKYFLNLTGRRDGSSRFGPGNQFANFGAIGAAWLFSEENFFKENLSFLNFGKLRSSFGLTGNDQIGNYGYLDLWGAYNIYQGSSTLVPSNFAPNPDFAWETNKKFEIAMQLGFLDDRINLEVSHYTNISSNQLLLQSLPLSSSKLFVYQNLPAKVKNDGWEVEANFKIISGERFKWSANVNVTVPKNKLMSYPGLETSINATVYKIGEPLNILKAYNVTVDQGTGLYTIEDKNGNGVQDGTDRYLTKFLGQVYYGGVQNSLSWKQFNLDFHFIFTKQNGKRLNAGTNPGRWLPGANSNQATNVLTRWQEPGNESLFQRFSTTTAANTLNSNNNLLGNLSVVDASFIKLRNISLGWTLPKNILSTLKISNATLNLQGQNLFTITNYVGLSPETQSIVVPPLRTIMMGINVTF